MKHLSLTELDDWLNFYYQHPQPELTPRAIATLSKENYFGEDSTQEPIMFFLSFIFRNHPHRIREFLFQLPTFPSLDQQVLVYSVWLSNTQESLTYLTELAQVNDTHTQETIKNLIKESPPEAEEIPINTPRILDILWSAFFATGEERYIVKIISALSNMNSPSIMDYAVLEAAKWSLRNNAENHKKVRSVCKDQLTKTPEDIALILQEILGIS